MWFMVATKVIAGHIAEFHGHMVNGVGLGPGPARMFVNLVQLMMTVNAHTKTVRAIAI